MSSLDAPSGAMDATVSTETTEVTSNKPAKANSVSQLRQTIREQKQRIAELELALHSTDREKSKALEEAQALTHLGSWQWDVATNSIAWSEELYRIYGIDPSHGEVSFDEFMGMIHPEDRERVGGIIGAAFESGEPFSFEHRIVLPGGGSRYLHGMGKVLLNAEGQPIRMIGTSQDISARIAADAALHRSNERFEAVTKATHDLVYDLDLQRSTIWFNEVLQNDYGYDEKASENSLKWWLDHIHPDDRQAVKDELDAVRKAKGNGLPRTWEAEYQFRKADDTYCLVRNRAFVVHDNNGKPERVVGSCQDITEAKRLDRAKDEFISLVSHQLRTPLTVIQLYGNMLRGGLAEPLKPDQQQYVDKMTDASVRLIKLVGDILNISRMELKRITVDTKPTDINKLIQVHIDELTPAAQSKQVAISFKPNARLHPVGVDSTIFGEIIHNLISNAVRYTRANGGKINVSFERDHDGHLLTVHDNGIGIPESAQPHIFERFYRADNATRVNGEGTGLGLYLVRLFSETTGAKTWFESKHQQGTTFYVQLPSGGMKAHRPLEDM